MASHEHAPGFEPGRGYTQEDWDEVCDTPELTAGDFAKSRPLAETMPELVAAMERRRGPQKAPTKALVSLRLDKDVLATLRASGPGWQGRTNDMLRKGLGLGELRMTSISDYGAEPVASYPEARSGKIQASKEVKDAVDASAKATAEMLDRALKGL